jgi:protocatechuate 3,4-dioxygenase, beta subunit
LKNQVVAALTKLIFMKPLLFSFFLLLLGQACAQNNKTNPRVMGKVGAPCEGCEAICECPVYFTQLKSSVEMPDWNEKGPKLVVRGVVFKADGQTPAPDIILYFYHTDQTGIYPRKGDEVGWAKRHGYIRSWIKTNEKGEYSFSTLRPAPYPGRNDPAHIHITLKEPDMNEYWIDEFVFADDPLLTQEQIARLENRGGSGILSTSLENNTLKATRNIVLGKNIPGYQVKK